MESKTRMKRKTIVKLFFQAPMGFLSCPIEEMYFNIPSLYKKKVEIFIYLTHSFSVMSSENDQESTVLLLNISVLNIVVVNKI